MRKGDRQARINRSYFTNLWPYPVPVFHIKLIYMPGSMKKMLMVIRPISPQFSLRVFSRHKVGDIKNGNPCLFFLSTFLSSLACCILLPLLFHHRSHKISDCSTFGCKGTNFSYHFYKSSHIYYALWDPHMKRTVVCRIFLKEPLRVTKILFCGRDVNFFTLGRYQL